MIDIIQNIPSLPDGWQGSPDDLLQFIAENATFEFDGDLPAGQVGGARPTADVGIWYGNNSIERWDATSGKYVPISDVPVGSIIFTASAASSPPENFLFCKKQSLVRVDYPELFLQIGTTWGTESPTTFSLPNIAGRFIIGAGTADYNQNTTRPYNGKGPVFGVGEYLGKDWVTQETAYANAAVASMKRIPGIIASGSKYLDCLNPLLVMQGMIRIR